LDGTALIRSDVKKGLLAAICLSWPLLLTAQQSDRCRVVHGRARFYSGDGQLRIWEIGTHHEFQPDGTSDGLVIGWLEAGVPEADRHNYAAPASAVDMFGDFLVCPTEPFKKGSVQKAFIKSAAHRRYVAK
jgi:hypothetical protein